MKSSKTLGDDLRTLYSLATVRIGAAAGDVCNAFGKAVADAERVESGGALGFGEYEEIRQLAAAGLGVWFVEVSLAADCGRLPERRYFPAFFHNETMQARSVKCGACMAKGAAARVGSELARRVDVSKPKAANEDVIVRKRVERASDELFCGGVYSEGLEALVFKLESVRDYCERRCDYIAMKYEGLLF